MKTYLVPFEEVETVKIAYEAKVHANNASEAFDKLKRIIADGDSPHCYVDEVQHTMDDGKIYGIQYNIEAITNDIIEHIDSDNKYDIDDYSVDDVIEVDERVYCTLELTAFDIARYGKDELYRMVEANFVEVGLELEIFEMEMIPTKIEEHFVSYKCIPTDFTRTFTDGDLLHMKDGKKIKREYCDCCDSAWIEILDEGQETYYVCSMCRDNDSNRFTKSNSKDCDIPFDVGN